MSGIRRVVITGFGLISPLGNSPEALWNALQQRRSGVVRLSSLPVDSLPIQCGGEARDFTGDIGDFGPLDKAKTRAIKRGRKLMCREIQMGVAAAQLALDHAGLSEDIRNPERTGVVFGSDYIMTTPFEFVDGIGACLNDDGTFDFDRWGVDGREKVDPLWLLKFLPNMPASHITIYNDLRGPNNSITLREASANLSLGEAYCTISRGSADAIVAGATGTRVHPLRTLHVILQEELAAPNGVAPEQLSRPFDAGRSGMVIGEGAGAIALEELETAQRRNATIYGEVVGYGSSTVMSRRGEPNCGLAVENAIRQSLATAKCAADSVGHVHAHGNSSLRQDAQEAQAIRRVFGDNTPPVTALKSYTGNLGAGAGVVEAICSIQCLNANQLAPVLNFETPDPECPIAVNQDWSTPAGD
ncbi:MAG: beta-ketoacyl-[acyl-carrier-protein] synthase family protein, partial [Pirellulaceae bacterium]|nr:beta-ketoacyl-[acyl-carrier-protein] synthase family protein [Pirellulaceae bacterium]